MNKAGLVEVVHNLLQGTKVQSEQVVEAIFDAMTASLKKGGDVSVPGFGIFVVKKRDARIARNPKTGESVKVPATKVVKFRVAKALKEAVAK